VKDVDIMSEEDEYVWAFNFLACELRIIKKTNERFLNFVEPEDKRIDSELWAEQGIGFKNLHADFKKINEKRRISTYKNAILQFNAKNKFLRNMCESIDLMQSSDLVRNMSLVYLVAVFENFIQRVLLISFRKKPETLRTCQKNLNYEELLKFSNIDEVREGIIEKEIMVVNEDIEDIRKYIKKRFGIEISEFVEDSEKIQQFIKMKLGIEISKAFNWNEFKERFYRRNLLIHNSGMPNKLYRQKTGYKGENECLKVSMEYLIESISLFSQISMNIGLAFEEKMKKV
jgi:hypothetical protein